MYVDIAHAQTHSAIMQLMQMMGMKMSRPMPIQKRAKTRAVAMAKRKTPPTNVVKMRSGMKPKNAREKARL